ncbi:hypothetical protein Mal48_20500 [Thalassoglobus polymorphus]|uniref:Uncharacterized protein n=2 Tax=Thalassoglobus polymorphus TaxID=2527994 RepID=A0A517QMF1_9PLAN|nr:hypothetical protein Mal48_20500 [Thalassoglobus polymorphus]
MLSPAIMEFQDGTRSMLFRTLNLLPVLLLTTPVLLAPAVSLAQVVPGTGTLINTDDFEKDDFEFELNWPKSSREEDKNVRYPLGKSSNGMWFESPKRGMPDVLKRVETPAGGIEGSLGALYMRSRDTGIPGRPGFKQAQDDLIMSAKPMTLGYYPNYTVRVFLPDWDQWEQRRGVSFGIRAGMQGPQEKEVEGGFGRRLFRRLNRTETKIEPYYPGFFIHFTPKDDPTNKTGEAYANILIRANHLGHEVPGPVIKQPGWWTFGMSVTPDGRCHYYASPGVDDLTSKDHITTQFPYQIQGTHFNTIFFNVCSADDGKSWSTPWIIDDPKVFYASGSQTQQARRSGSTFR